jgi:hypothetical protein
MPTAVNDLNARQWRHAGAEYIDKGQITGFGVDQILNVIDGIKSDLIRDATY